MIGESEANSLLVEPGLQWAAEPRDYYYHYHYYLLLLLLLLIKNYIHVEIKRRLKAVVFTPNIFFY